MAGTVAAATGARDATRLEPLVIFSFFFITLILILGLATYKSQLGMNEGRFFCYYLYI